MKFTRRLKTALFICCCIVASLAWQPAREQAATNEQAEYAGNQACARCHEAIWRSYAATPMANSSGILGDDIVAGTFTHQTSGIRYGIERAGGATYLKYERSGARALRGQQQLHYFIGSNAVGQSYLFAIDRFLFQAPVTFYAAARRWDASPGYETDRGLRMNRPVDASCLYCHASQTQAVFGTQNRFVAPPFQQGGISCERCHGPGSLHVARRAKLINPARLTPTRRDDVCAQCHLAGAARVELPGRHLAAYRPGDALADYVTYFVFAGGQAEGLKVNSHTENLAQSVCKQQSGDRLSCLSCHDPHRTLAPAERASYYRARCLNCHQVARLPATHERAADCVSCHLPRARAVDGGHGVMTDHSIPRRPPSSSPPTIKSPRRLVPFSGFTADDRALGLAYAEVALTSSEQFHAAEALRLLTAALSQHPRDAELLTRLGFLHEQRGDAARAALAYESVLRVDPRRTVALVNLGGLYAAQGKLEDAAQAWRTALQCNAGLTEASLNLAQVYRLQGKLPLAREVLRQALRFAPDASAVKAMLKEIE